MGARSFFGRDGRPTAGLVIGLVLFLVTCAELIGQNSWITETIVPQLIEENTMTLLRIGILFPDSDNVSIDEPPLPDGLRYESGPFIRPVRIEGKTIIEFSILGEKPGRYIIPSFTIHMPDWDWKTHALALFVKESTSDGKVPVNLFWDFPNTPIFAGQAVPVTIWADMAEEELPAIEIQSISHPDILSRSMDLTDSPIPITVSNKELQRVPLGSFMYLFPRAGEFAFPSKRISLDGVEAILPALSLNVWPVSGQEGDNEILGVGDFVFTYNIDRNVAQGYNLIKLTMNYTGEGNFIFLQFPEPETKNLDNLTSVVKQEYTPLLTPPYGYSGYKRKTIIYRQLGNRRGELSIPEVVIYNPATGRQPVHSGNIHTFAAVPIDWDHNDAAGPPDIPNPDQIGPLRVFRMYAEPAAYLLFIPPLIILLVSVFLPRRTNAGLVSILVLLFSCNSAPGTPPFAEPGIKRIERIKRIESIEMYERGFRSVLKGEYGEGIYHFRRLHRLRPMDTRILDTIEKTEAEAKIDHQRPANFLPHPDIFFWAALALAYTTALFSLFRRRRGKGIPIPLVVLVFLLMVGLYFSARAISLPIGVLKEDAALLVIPEPQGTRKMILKEGTAVNIKNSWEDFYQIRTGDEIIGWLHKSNLWL